MRSFCVKKIDVKQLKTIKLRFSKEALTSIARFWPPSLRFYAGKLLKTAQFLTYKGSAEFCCLFLHPKLRFCQLELINIAQLFAYNFCAFFIRNQNMNQRYDNKVPGIRGVKCIDTIKLGKNHQVPLGNTD